MTKQISYLRKQATVDDIENHLMRCDQRFVPVLSERVNLREYAEKIFNYAITFEAWNADKLVGLVAVYFDDKIQREGFVTSVSVDFELQGRGIARDLFKNCYKYSYAQNFSSLRLEVIKSNARAIQLYEELGFEPIGDNKEIITMRKYLSIDESKDLPS